MSGRTYGWALRNDGFVEVSENEYTEHHKEKQKFLNNVSAVVLQAECGWHRVVYKLMRRGKDYEAEYAVLLTKSNDSSTGGRWINISGSSKGAILRAIGENLF